MENYVADFGLRPNPENAESTEARVCMLRQFFAYEHIKEHITNESKVLELGSGVGYGAKIISEKAKHVLGLDLEKEAVDFANSRYGGDSCEFRVFDGYTVSCGDGEYDAIVAIQVIEHVEDEARFIAEARRVLKPGGVFIATTPNKAFRLKPGQKPWNKHHLREYTAEELETLFRRVFSDVKILGVRGTDEIQEMELRRWSWSRGGALSGSAVSRLLPSNVKTAIKKILKKDAAPAPTELKPADQYSINDFYVTDRGDGLDLLAICK